MSVSRRILWGIGVWAGLQAMAWAQTVPLVGDTYILPGSAGNAGAGASVSIGGAQGYQGLLAFDLTKLPAGTTAAGVTSAWLRLYVNKVGAAGSVNVYTATSAWSEGTVNGLPGGPLPGSLVAGPIGISTAGAFVSIPITGQVQAWLNGAPNNGLLIQASPSSTSLAFDSKENASTSHPAVIEVVLTPPAGATGPMGLQGPPGPAGPTGPVGATGPKGDTGAQGAQGLAGAAGTVGPTGLAGPVGTPGDPGAQGLAGAAGVQGTIGPAGPAGVAGAAGPPGGPGPVGTTGLRGPNGSQGPPGATGSVGVAGPQGVILNSFAISAVQPAGTISSGLTQSVILVNNTSAGVVNVTLPSAGAGTAGKDIWIDGNDFSNGGNSMTIFAGTGDELIIHNVVVCSSTPSGLQACTAGSFGPINYRIHVVSDGNHKWFAVQWD